MINKIRVDLKERSYDIVIDNNAIAYLPEFLRDKKYSKIFIMTDKNVANHHLKRLNEVLVDVKVAKEIIIVEAGEQTKSFQYLEKVCEEMLQKNVDRKSLIIAFGGGVIGDLAGFIASILVRGVDFIQVPTTLLAAVDSSVGGKTAINTKSGKNLIGSFYQPKLVVCDLNFLRTLPIREIRSGYAEILKYGLIQDESFFKYLTREYKQVFACEREVLREVISRACEIKAEIVSKDERENGLRALLNFGHTFGHIFETETGYSSEILHGEAVALGMLMAAKMSLNFDMIGEKDFNKIKVHLEECGFVIDAKKIRNYWNKESLVNHLFKDKKNENQQLTFILLEAIGCSVIRKAVDLDDFLDVLVEFV